MLLRYSPLNLIAKYNQEFRALDTLFEARRCFDNDASNSTISDLLWVQLVQHGDHAAECI
jgi:hypothetical protein